MCIRQLYCLYFPFNSIYICYVTVCRSYARNKRICVFDNYTVYTSRLIVYIYIYISVCNRLSFVRAQQTHICIQQLYCIYFPFNSIYISVCNRLSFVRAQQTHMCMQQLYCLYFPFNSIYICYVTFIVHTRSTNAYMYSTIILYILPV